MHSNHKLIEIQAHNEPKVFFEALISVRSWDFTEALGLNMHMRFKLVCRCTNAAHASQNMLAQIWDNYMGGMAVLFCFVLLYAQSFLFSKKQSDLITENKGF